MEKTLIYKFSKAKKTLKMYCETKQKKYQGQFTVYRKILNRLYGVLTPKLGVFMNYTFFGHILVFRMNSKGNFGHNELFFSDILV